MLQPINIPTQRLVQMGFTQEEALTLSDTAHLVQRLAQLGFSSSFHQMIQLSADARRVELNLASLSRRLQEQQA